MSSRNKDGKRGGKRELPTPPNSNLIGQNNANTPEGSGTNSSNGGQSGEKQSTVPATKEGSSQNKVPKKNAQGKNTQVNNCYNGSDKPINQEDNGKTQEGASTTGNVESTEQEKTLTALEILKQCSGLEDLGIDVESIVEELCLPAEELEQLEPDVALARVRAFLQEVNEVRVQLARLDSNLAGLVYYENEVFPLLNLLFLLAGIATDYSLYARNLIQVSVARTSKVKEACELSYDILRLTEEVYELLAYKARKLLRILSNS